MIALLITVQDIGFITHLIVLSNMRVTYRYILFTNNSLAGLDTHHHRYKICP